MIGTLQRTPSDIVFCVIHRWNNVENSKLGQNRVSGLLDVSDEVDLEALMGIQWKKWSNLVKKCIQKYKPVGWLFLGSMS